MFAACPPGPYDYLCFLRDFLAFGAGLQHPFIPLSWNSPGGSEYTSNEGRILTFGLKVCKYDLHGAIWDIVAVSDLLVEALLLRARAYCYLMKACQDGCPNSGFRV